MAQKAQKPLWFLGFPNRYLFRFAMLVGGLWDLKGPFENIVVSVRSTELASDTPCFLPCRAPFIRHRRRLHSKPTTSSVGRGHRSHFHNQSKKDTLMGILCFGIQSLTLYNAPLFQRVVHILRLILQFSASGQLGQNGQTARLPLPSVV